MEWAVVGRPKAKSVHIFFYFFLTNAFSSPCPWGLGPGSRAGAVRGEWNGQWLPGWPPTQLRDLVRTTQKGCAKGQRPHRRALMFLWGMHSSLNSHQSWEEAGQGLGDLLTVVASSLHLDPKTQSWGWEEERVKKREIQGLRAKPPPIFIAGELEICFSLPVLGRWTLRGPQEK